VQEEVKVEEEVQIAVMKKSTMPKVERKAIDGPSHVQFLWSTKLKSRDSFLTILDFLPLAKSHYKGLLGLLQPAYESGHSFYEHHVIDKFEIGTHKVYRTSKFFINDSLTLGNPGWFPSKESIKQLTEKALKDVQLTSIAYSGENWLQRLTFVFGSGVMSPPAGTYQTDPTEEFRLEGKPQIGGLGFVEKSILSDTFLG